MAIINKCLNTIYLAHLLYRKSSSAVYEISLDYDLNRLYGYPQGLLHNGKR